MLLAKLKLSLYTRFLDTILGSWPMMAFLEWLMMSTGNGNWNSNMGFGSSCWILSAKPSIGSSQGQS